MRILSIENEYVHERFSATENIIDVCESGRDSNLIYSIYGLFSYMRNNVMSPKYAKITVEYKGKVFEIEYQDKKQDVTEQDTFGFRQGITHTCRLVEGSISDKERALLEKNWTEYFGISGLSGYYRYWTMARESITNEILSEINDEVQRIERIKENKPQTREALRDVLQKDKRVLLHRDVALSFINAFTPITVYGCTILFNEQNQLCAAVEGQTYVLNRRLTLDHALHDKLKPDDLLIAHQLWAALCQSSGDEDDCPIIVDFFHSHLAMNDADEVAYFVREFAKFGRQVFFVHSDNQCAGIDKLCDRTINIRDYWE